MRYTIKSITDKYVSNQVKVWFKDNDEPIVGVLLLNDPKKYHTMNAPFYLVVKKGHHNNYVFGPTCVKKIEFDNTDYLAEAGNKEIIFDDCISH